MKRFETCRVASGLATKDEKTQVNMLVYLLGEKGDDIFMSFGLSNEESKNYENVTAQFHDHFQHEVICCR